MPKTLKLFTPGAMPKNGKSGRGAGKKSDGVPASPVLDLCQLKTFAMVASTRNFTRAALELGCSQPSVTHRIKGLEHQLGVTLLNRARLTRDVTLTRVGSLTVEYARQLLALAEEAESAIGKMRNGTQRRNGAS